MVLSAYRPFCPQWLYRDPHFNQRTYQLGRIYPTPHHVNVGIELTGVSSHFDFTPFISAHLPDLHLLDTGQYFPRYTYEKVEGDGALFGGLDSTTGETSDVDEYGYRRIDNITDAGLASYLGRYGPQVTKDDIFYYV